MGQEKDSKGGRHALGIFLTFEGHGEMQRLVQR